MNAPLTGWLPKRGPATITRSNTIAQRVSPAMMIAPVRSPKKYETPAVTASRISRALRNCRPRTAMTRT